MVSFIRKNSKLLFALFVPVYFFIAQSSLQNRHTHISANGIVIIHSHPVTHTNHEPINAHDHSDSEIYFYHLVNFDYYTYPSEMPFNLQITLFPQIYPLFNEQSDCQYSVHQPVTRGPPTSRFASVYQAA